MVKVGRVDEAVADLEVVVASDLSNKVAVRELANANKLLADNAVVDHDDDDADDDDDDDDDERSREGEQEGTTGEQQEKGAIAATVESTAAATAAAEDMAGTVVSDSQQSAKTFKQMHESLHLADIRETASRYVWLVMGLQP